MGAAAGNISQRLRLFCLLALLVIFGCHCGITVNAQSSMPAVFISLNQVWSDFMNINCPAASRGGRWISVSLIIFLA